jgi:hypothetical protein
MNPLQLTELLIGQALSVNAERHQRWTTASYRVAAVLPNAPILVADIQKAGRLDCVVGELEREMARLTAKRTTSHVRP